MDKGVKSEHCDGALGCDVEFTTTNYKITTTPKKEYEIATGLRECPEEDKKDGERKKLVRKIQSVDELHRQQIAVDAGLLLLEVLVIVSDFFAFKNESLAAEMYAFAQVLYTGPMFQVCRL